MRSKSVRTQSRFLSCIKFPFRVLARARDLYMQSLTAAAAAGGVTFGNSMGCPTPHIPSLPRSLSANSAFKTADDQLWDLIKIPTQTGRTGPELRRTRSSMPLGGGGGGGGGVVAVPRSKTVAYGRIDEDREFELGDDDRIGLLGKLVYPRSRRTAVSTN